MAQTSRRQIVEHRGLGAGMFAALGLGEVVDKATHPNPARRDLTVGEAVKAMGRNGLGLGNHARSLVLRFFQPQPASRLIAPRVPSAPLNDAALGRAWETLEA